MKRFILCFSCIIAIILLSGCSMGNTPTKKVENFLDNYKNQDETVITQLNDMIDTDSLMTDDQKDTYRDIMKKQYEDLTYEIKDEVIDGDTATVTAEIEVYDYYKANKEAEDYYNSNPSEYNTKGALKTDDAVENAAEDVKDTAKDAAEGAKDGIEDTAKGAKNVAEDAADTAKDAAKDAVDKAKDAVDSGTNIITDDNNDVKYVEYRLKKLQDIKDRVTYTIEFTLTKVHDVWTLNDIDDITRQKIHGLYEH